VESRANATKDPKAIASLVLGIIPFAFLALTRLLTGELCQPLLGLYLSLGILCLTPVVAVIAVALGHSARASIRQNRKRLQDKKIATAGLVFGYVGQAGWVLGIVCFCPLLGPMSRWILYRETAIESFNRVPRGRAKTPGLGGRRRPADRSSEVLKHSLAKPPSRGDRQERVGTFFRGLRGLCGFAPWREIVLISSRLLKSQAVE